MSEVNLLVLYMRKRLMSHTESDVFYEIEMPDYRPATTAEIMEAYREICKAQGKQMYQINGEEVWLTPYAGESLNLAIRAYGRHWEAKG